MRRSVVPFVAIAIGVVAILVAGLLSGPRKRALPVKEMLAAHQDDASLAGLTILYPRPGTLFPPEIAPPAFRWKDDTVGSDSWLVGIAFEDSPEPMTFVTPLPEWTPPPADWETIKKRSLEREARVTILGFGRSAPKTIQSGSRVSIRTSKDPVGAPLFYREVNLPFKDAAKDPRAIRWRFGPIASLQPPPVVLENLLVCGNCHSFPADGKALAMDVDYANSKGSYIITRTAEEMTLATSEIITWDDFKKEDGEMTFGLLSQISPDGRVVVSTVKDKSVFVPRPDLAFSQLFFPIKGILAVYSRDTDTFQALPGADDPKLVQSNPTWSPDGKHIVFARTGAYKLRSSGDPGKILLSPEECDEFLKDGKPFKFDLCRIPFNGGKGGAPEPLKGASNNGKSNFFARYSPDGKWIVFCQARSYMLLQPDSELFIIPAEGGEARRLECNTRRMNSWHSWSPNGKWLVFSSKANSAYTQLFLTHMDEQGRSTPPVLLDRFTASDRAANIPEFVNAPPTAIKRIHEQFVNDNSHLRAADAFFRADDVDGAIREYRETLRINPANARAHQRLGSVLYFSKKQADEGVGHLYEALRLEPKDPLTRCDLGLTLSQLGKHDEAIPHLTEALRQLPDGFGKQYSAQEMHYHLGGALVLTGKPKEASEHLAEAVHRNPRDEEAHYLLALALAQQGDVNEAAKYYSAAVALRPTVDNSVLLHDLMAANYAKAGRFREAIASGEKALGMARAAGNDAFVKTMAERIEEYKRRLNQK